MDEKTSLLVAYITFDVDKAFHLGDQWVKLDYVRLKLHC